jgi:hypothetical protein
MRQFRVDTRLQWSGSDDLGELVPPHVLQESDLEHTYTLLMGWVGRTETIGLDPDLLGWSIPTTLRHWPLLMCMNQEGPTITRCLVDGAKCAQHLG